MPLNRHNVEPTYQPHTKQLIRGQFSNCSDGLPLSRFRGLDQITYLRNVSIYHRFLWVSKFLSSFMKFNWANSVRALHICNGVQSTLRHDDVIKWKHFPRHWPFVRGIHGSPVKSTHKGQWCGALMNDWVNTHEAGDLRRHRAHCDVIVMDYSWYYDRMLQSSPVITSRKLAVGDVPAVRNYQHEIILSHTDLLYIILGKVASNIVG